MKKHNWTTEEIDGGNLGSADFWICHDCGASGGPVWYDQNGPKEQSWQPFYADGSGLKLSDNCDEAKKQIINYELFCKVLY